MNRDEARRTAWKILGEVEEMMSGRGVGILARGRHDSSREKAFFMDCEYHELEDAVTDILMEEPEIRPRWHGFPHLSWRRSQSRATTLTQNK